MQPEVTYNMVCVVCNERWASTEHPIGEVVHMSLCQAHQGKTLCHEPGYKASHDAAQHKRRMAKKRGLAVRQEESGTPAPERKHTRGSSKELYGIIAVPTVELKQAYTRNKDFEAVGLEGFKPLVIKIRKCIACKKLFESISHRSCGCRSADYLAPTSLYGVECIYADHWPVTERIKQVGSQRGPKGDDKLPPFRGRPSRGGAWIPYHVQGKRANE